jgi:hypothetical protein
MIPLRRFDGPPPAGGAWPDVIGVDGLVVELVEYAQDGCRARPCLHRVASWW